MKRKLEIHQIDAFTDILFRGNPAGVTFGDGLSSSEMQLIAREMNLSETAFISSSKVADFKLQWFTPTSEVKLCGHATIASLHFLTNKKRLKDKQQIKFETLSGVLNCYRNKEQFFMQIPIPKISESKKPKDQILKILGIKLNHLADSKPFIIVNGETCYINVKSLNDLKKINPNFNELLNFGKINKEFRIIVVYTLETYEPDNYAHSRCFVPYYGINEDPVTGSANGPLLLVLKKLGLLGKSKNIIKVTFEQGDSFGRNGRVGVTFDSIKNELYISGRAVTVLKATMVY